MSSFDATIPASATRANRAPHAAKPPSRRRGSAAGSLFAGGEPMIWLTGGAMLLSIVMVIGLLLLVVWFGGATFWPQPIVRVVTADGPYMGEITRQDWYTPQPAILEALPPDELTPAKTQMAQAEGQLHRQLFRTGNFRITQQHFAWVNDYQIIEQDQPHWAVILERMEWGRFYGLPERFLIIHERIDSQTQPAQPTQPTNAKPTHGGTMHWMTATPNASGDDLLPLDALNAPGATESPATTTTANSATNPQIIALVEVIEGAESAWATFELLHEEARERRETRRRIEDVDIGRVNHRQEAARLAVKEAELDFEDARTTYGPDSDAAGYASKSLAEAQQEYEEARAWADQRFAEYRREINAIDEANSRLLVEFTTAGEGAMPPARVRQQLDEIVRGYTANRLSTLNKLGIYFSRWNEFLFAQPREANSEGGVWPALFGTVVMTLLMSLAVVPFGVLSALYLREYAHGGLLVSAVRIAVNNLAGVPSIVFGVFGLGFFCYLVGGFMDGGPENIQVAPMPTFTWWLLLAAAVVTSVAAFFLWVHGLRIARRPDVSSLRRALVQRSMVFIWLLSVAAIVMLIVKSPFFDGFARASLPNPTFGKGGVLWASLTLALLTLPVVIVATEEALAAVPNSMREGSLACGASKWQTIQRIVLPRAMPGIMTGAILAMARGAGEVAPLMLVGAVKLAPDLPIDGQFPYVHLHRSFMHLGFHIYDVGFQSQNSEAAKPMVYTTTLLLIFLVTLLNLAAIYLRARLRRRFVSNQF